MQLRLIIQEPGRPKVFVILKPIVQDTVILSDVKQYILHIQLNPQSLRSGSMSDVSIYYKLYFFITLVNDFLNRK